MSFRPQASIARTMLVVLFVAVDAALLRMTYRRTFLPLHEPGAFLLVPALQVAVLLAFPRRGVVRPFWAGFLTSGAVVLLLYSGARGPFHEIPNSWPSGLYHFLSSRGFDIRRLSGDEYQSRLISAAYVLTVIGLPLLLLPAAWW